jgi:methylglyoxal reductase
MRYLPLGASGIDASVVGIGTWAIGGWMWGGADENQSINAIHASLDAGVNLIDTAPAYGFGAAEQVVGKAISDRRENVVLATKCGQRWDIEQGDFLHTEPGGRHFYRYLHPVGIREEIEQSLRRLKTDYIDLYQTHWQDSTTSIEETMDCLLQLKSEGKIRAIGVCNASLSQIEEYREVGLLDTDQERFNMLDQPVESQQPVDDPRKWRICVKQLPHLQANNIAFIAYSSLAMGLLTGKVKADQQFPEGHVRRLNPRFSSENRERATEMLSHFSPIAKAYNVTLAQLAIAWTLAQDGVTHVLAGARNSQQASENAASAGLDCRDEFSEMDKILQRYRPQMI